MCRIPHACRRNGRYVFRRRIHFRNIISKPVAIALQTADPSLARERAALLSARFAVVRSSVNKMMETGRLMSEAEIEALFRKELEDELRAHVQRAFENDEWSSSALQIAADDVERYRVLSGPDRHDQDLLEYARDLIPDEFIAERLTAIGAPVDSLSVAAARTHLIRARAVACARVQRLFEDAIMDAPDPVRALMAALGEPSAEAARLLGSDRGQLVAQTSTAPTVDGHFLEYEERCFGDVIEDVIAELKAEGTWKGGFEQKRRIMQTFAWITGNRELGSYDHRDIAAFKRGLMRLPTTFQ